MKNCLICKSEKDISKINEIILNIPSDINLNSKLDIYYCSSCYYYYSDSNNNQDDYNNYYKNFNNYKEYVISEDKDLKCCEFLKSQLNKNNIKNVIDYGCGNSVLYNLLKSYYNDVDTYDIGMPEIEKKYDCVVISHVLEHIYDINDFISNINNVLNDDGYVYIEVPNAEFYKEFKNNGPLQEINIEHINFFSKYALNKLMLKHNFVASVIIDDYFMLNNNKYYIIRGLFKKVKNNNSFINYLEYGVNQINSLDIKVYNNLYIYCCGQFLFKILHKFKNSNIINIVDDNQCYLNKTINNIEIIDFNILESKIKENDNIFIATIISAKNIINKLKKLDIKINIYCIESNKVILLV